MTKQEQPGKEPFIAATGGRVDEGEDVLTAARRELLEESGYIAKDLFLWVANQPIGKIEWAVYIFIAKGLKKISDLKPDVGEKIEPYPVTFDELLELSTKGNFYEREVAYQFLEAKLNPKKYEELKKLFSSINEKDGR